MHQETGKGSRIPRFFSVGYLRAHVWPISIAALCLYYAVVDLGGAYGELETRYHELRQDFDVRTVVGQINVKVKQQVQNLQGKDAGRLAGEYGWFLHNWNCPLIVHCEPVDRAAKGTTLEQRMQEVATARTEPVLFLPNSPIPIPCFIVWVAMRN